MKNITILILMIAALSAARCTRYDEYTPAVEGEGETWVTLDFGGGDYDQVSISTRSVLEQTAESRVQNLYVFIFDSDGKRVYGHYFDNKSLLSDAASVRTADTECWYVKTPSDKTDADADGCIRARVPLIASGGEIFIVANIDADMVNISPERLNYIHSKADMIALSASLNQLITSRNGYFPMSGSRGNISITKDKIMADGATGFTLWLYRLDARIEVNIKVAEGYFSETDVDYDADGDGKPESAVRKQTISEFRPESWQVINLPRGCFVCERDKAGATADNPADSPTGYFNSEEVNFETVSAKSSGFGFYMLENRPAAKGAAGTFAGRDRRIKDAAGAYDESDGLWVNAPEEGTYLVIKGEVLMDVNVSTEAHTQKLNAAVTYYIHLGDFGSGDVDNYDIERNTRYVYNITIKGVDSIQAEVEKSEEREPAATGDVYIAKESIYTFDAHYGQRAFSFDEAFITPSTVTWYVKTPFGREGTPTIINGVEVPNGLDYEWVHFLVNKPVNANSPLSPYSHVQQSYSPDAMNVVDFVAYIKDQKTRFDQRKRDYPDDPSQWTVGNDFRPEIDDAYSDGQKTRYRIWATVFVDEYYYEENPISGDKDPELWKRFVNQPNRVIHLLCDTHFSTDRDSSTTASVVTIRQRSIQSIFDPDAPVTSAWGCETVDEMSGKLWFYDARETTADGQSNSYVTDYSKIDYGNSSRTNGLYNSVRLWEMVDKSGNWLSGRKWEDYLDFNKENAEEDDTYFLKDDDNALFTARYACMSRNRDNNGDGVIDASELRWYMASILQLTNFYIGQAGLSGDAILYPQSLADLYTEDDPTDALGFHPWRSHIISSTRDISTKNTNWPTILWAEEGLSTSNYREPEISSWNQAGRYSIRCVRNLGADPESETAAQEALKSDDLPFDPVTQISGPGIGDNTDTPVEESVYRIDLSNMNRKSVRFYTTKELEVADEFSEMSRTYLAFETGPLSDTKYSFTELEALLDAGQSPCPEGYRVPNFREAALMSVYIPYPSSSSWWLGTADANVLLCCTRYSIQNKTWVVRPAHLNQIDLSKNTTAYSVRCVRDVR